jgi:hypothetical protein
MAQHYGQPQALVGNPFSDAYFGALSRGSQAAQPACCFCKSSLAGKTRLTDGVLSWCDEGHRQMWVASQRRGSQRQFLVNRGWSPEREAALAELDQEG